MLKTRKNKINIMYVNSKNKKGKNEKKFRHIMIKLKGSNWKRLEKIKEKRKKKNIKKEESYN